jgi:hypothetical protein
MRSIISVTVSVLLASACSEGTTESGRQTRSDSAGIEIVHSHAEVWSEQTRWRLSEEPILQIGTVAGDSSYLLHSAHTAFRLSDKRVAVANMGTNELRYFDSTGKFIRNTGREGQGPGEWDQLYGLHRGGGDTLVVLEPGANNTEHHVISGAGDFVHTFTLESVTRRDNIWAVGITSTGFVVGYSLIENPPREGFYRDMYQHFVFDMRGRMIDSIGMLVGQGFSGLDGEPGMFSPRGYYSVRGDKLYFGVGDRHETRIYRIEVIVATGDPAALRASNPEQPLARMVLERLVRRDPDRPLEITPEVIERQKETQRKFWRDRLAKGQGPNVNIESQISRMRFPERFPAQQRLLVDSERNIWEQRYKIPGDTVDTFSVYDSIGAWLGLVEMPQGFRPTDIGRDYILGIWRNEDDVPFVRVYRLAK